MPLIQWLAQWAWYISFNSPFGVHNPWSLGQRQEWAWVMYYWLSHLVLGIC